MPTRLAIRRFVAAARPWPTNSAAAAGLGPPHCLPRCFAARPHPRLSQTARSARLSRHRIHMRCIGQQLSSVGVSGPIKDVARRHWRSPSGTPEGNTVSPYPVVLGEPGDGGDVVANAPAASATSSTRTMAQPGSPRRPSRAIDCAERFWEWAKHATVRENGM